VFKKYLNKYKKYIKAGFWILVLILLIYLILPDKETITEALEAIKGVSIPLLILGSTIYYLTIPIYALQINVLSKIKLEFLITYKVQMSVLFINKFIPSGISSFVMNSFYLARKNLKPSEVASIITMQGLTSVIPFSLMLLIALIIAIYQYNLLDFLDFNFSELNIKRIIALSFIIILLSIYVIKTSLKVKNFLDKVFGSFWIQVKLFKERPTDLFWALLTGFIAPLFGVAVLYISGYAVGINVTFVQAFLIYSLGTTLANLIPVPGGMGAAVAGLYAGFMFFGFSSAEALAASIVYRLITFWIPTIPGVIFFMNLRKNILKDFSLAEEFQKAKHIKKA
jgi:glycosyltransferase 2 family protein